MPFGLTNVPATFQRAIDLLLSGVKCKHFVVYYDDVIIYSKSEKEHTQYVDEVLGILRRAGLSLSFEKSEFFRPSVKYLGLKISPGKLEVAMKRRSALEEFAFPKTQTQVRSFVGLRNAYRRFVKNFAKIEQPLNELVKKATLKDSTAPMEQRLDAFHTLKEALLHPPILCLPQPGTPYTVDVDASARQVGCTLWQEQATTRRVLESDSE